MTDPAPNSPAPRARWLRHLPLALIALVAVIGAATLRDYISFDTLRENRAALLELRDGNYLLMAGGFVAAYVAIVAFSLPGAAVASVTGGFLFGLGPGTALNVLSASLGAVAIFLAARAGLGQVLAARFDASEGRLGKLRDGLRQNEISVLLLLRLVPAVPFFVANLLPALVGVRLWNFAWTTALGIIPGALVFTSIGVGVGSVFDRGGTPDLSLLWAPQVIGPLLGLAALAALPIILRAWRARKGI
ncbi:TVP38/TMEM64 family protein [Salipiger mangrovisoli]|uniref:TVP38/TMEM64 family membrane protein n=1 Tax=Salipiger mangrovisoli TaxID=2865933 RepID=A0ABR9X620_9RHOB|nr:VTT domain-containing protein [Salipiger mangrovisoli]MBE9638969.1 TVP38/TMEM64 family protein [Salipiger mangrovisoli]